MSEAGWLDSSVLTEGVIGRRCVAWFIDAVLIGVLLLALKMGLFLLGLVTLGLGWFLFGGLWVVPAFYSFAFVASARQATPGQAALGLAVVRDDDLGRPTPAQALVYAAGYWITVSLGAVWLLAALFTARRRCLHDIVAGVLVARADGLPGTADGWTWRQGSAPR